MPSRQRLTAIVRMALGWAAFWSIGGTALSVIPIGIALVAGLSWDDMGSWGDIAVVVNLIPYLLVFWAVLGGLSGALFAVVVTLAERRHRFAELSVMRMVLWGLAGAIWIPVVATLLFGADPETTVGDQILVASITGGLGVTCAVGSLLLARRAGEPSDQVALGAEAPQSP